MKANYAAWSMPDNLLADARLTNGASYVEADGSLMSIAFEDYDSPGVDNAAFSTCTTSRSTGSRTAPTATVFRS